MFYLILQNIVCRRYGLIESYANGNNILAAESMEEITVPQEAINGTGE
jgi:hypothetical protein